MRSRFARSVVLACSLVLALPQSWCCTFSVPIANSSNVQSTGPANEGRCCPCCRIAAAPDSNSTEKTSPANKPADPPRIDCFCTGGHAILASTSSFAQWDGGLVATLVPLQLFSSCNHLMGRIVRSAMHPQAERLHVFKCVWLC